MKKKLFSLLLITTTILSLTACKKPATNITEEIASGSEIITETDSETLSEELSGENELGGFTDYMDPAKDFHDVFAEYEWLVGDTVLTKENTVEDLIAAFEKEYGDVGYSGWHGFDNSAQPDDMELNGNPTFEHKVMVYTGHTTQDRYDTPPRELTSFFKEGEMKTQEGLTAYLIETSKDGREYDGEFVYDIYLDQNIEDPGIYSIRIEIANNKGDYPNSVVKNDWGEDVFNGSYGSDVYFERDSLKIVAIETCTPGNWDKKIAEFRKVTNGQMLYDRYVVRYVHYFSDGTYGLSNGNKIDLQGGTSIIDEDVIEKLNEALVGKPD